jgi:hypothetical protein
LSTITSSFVTISCDAPECPKTVTFPQSEEGEKTAFAENVWMNSLRFVNSVDQRKFIYCSDECEAKGLGLGHHNKQVIVPAVAPNSVDLAAQAAERARQATEAIKSGHGKVVLG